MSRDLSSQGYGNAQDIQHDLSDTFDGRAIRDLAEAARYYEFLMRRTKETDPDRMLTLEEFFEKRGIKI